MIEFVKKYSANEVRELGSSWFVIALVKQADSLGSDQCLHALSVAERDRYASLRSSDRAKSYLMGRYAAKQAIAQLDLAPSSQWNIETGVYGQPIIQHAQNSKTALQVSISHVKDAAVAVVSPAGWPVCIDLEEVSRSNEKLLWDYLPISGIADRTGGALRCDEQCLTGMWSIIEAASKHLGGGLAIDMKVFEMDDMKMLQPQLLWTGFSNLPHIQAYSRLSTRFALSIVLPKPGCISDAGPGLFESEMRFLDQD